MDWIPGMKNIKLSEHFSFYELSHTIYADLLTENRTWAWEKRETLRQVAQVLLEPIRLKFGRPILISSGARSEDLNKRLKGAKESQHVLCQAADIVVDGLDCLEGSTAVFEWIYKESGIPFGQVIHEVRSGIKNGRPDDIWIHISLGEPCRAKGDSREVMTFRKGLYRVVTKGQT